MFYLSFIVVGLSRGGDRAKKALSQLTHFTTVNNSECTAMHCDATNYTQVYLIYD
jgi:hypothetical protein